MWNACRTSFFLAATAFGESALAIKIAALVCDALLALVIWRSLAAAGANRGWVLAWLNGDMKLLSIVARTIGRRRASSIAGCDL